MINKPDEEAWKKIDSRAIAIAIFVAVTEFELFVYPKQVVMFAGQDAWLAFLLGSIISTAGTWVLLKLASRFPRENLFEYNQSIWGRPISFLIALGYFLFWMIFLLVLLKDTAAANRLIFLPKTPAMVPMLIFVLSAAWLVIYGLSALVRFFQLMLPLILIPLLPIYIMAFKVIDWNNFFPIHGNGWIPVLKGAVIYAGALQGLEIILFLCPFLRNGKNVVVPGLIGINMVNILNLIHGVIAIGIMGTDSIKLSIWPGINSIQLIELPGFPVERFELFFTLPWITAIFTTLCLIIYLISYGIIQIFHVPWRKGTIFTVSISAVLGTYIIPSYLGKLKIMEFFQFPTLIFIFILPALTLIGAVLRGKRGNS